MTKTQDTPSTAIAIRSSSDLEQVAELSQILLGNQDLPDVAEDPEQISREIVAQILAAETDEDLQMNQAEGWRDLLGVPIELHGFRWRPSQYDGSDSGSTPAPLFFIVFGTRMDTGESVVLTTGGWNVLAQLVNLARRGRLVGATWKMEQATTPTARGYHPLWLVKVADPPATTAPAA